MEKIWALIGSTEAYKEYRLYTIGNILYFTRTTKWDNETIEVCFNTKTSICDLFKMQIFLLFFNNSSHNLRILKKTLKFLRVFWKN